MNLSDLQKKAQFHREKVDYYVEEVRILETKECEESLKKLIGKCFLISDWTECKQYCRIESYNEFYKLIGTKISTGVNNAMCVTVSSYIYANEIETAKPISKSRFNKYLTEFQESLKEKMG